MLFIRLCRRVRLHAKTPACRQRGTLSMQARTSRGAPLRIYRVEGKVNLYPVMHHQPG